MTEAADSDAPAVRTPHEEFWFNSGDIVLAAHSKLFRVHKDVLSTHSAIFREKILAAAEGVLQSDSNATTGGDVPGVAVASLPEVEWSEGVALVVMDDEEKAVEYLLKMLYFPLPFLGLKTKNFKAHVITPLLQISAKYQFAAIRTEIIQRLVPLLPYDFPVEGELIAVSEKVNGFGKFFSGTESSYHSGWTKGDVLGCFALASLFHQAGGELDVFLPFLYLCISTAVKDIKLDIPKVVSPMVKHHFPPTSFRVSGRSVHISNSILEGITRMNQRATPVVNILQEDGAVLCPGCKAMLRNLEESQKVDEDYPCFNFLCEDFCDFELYEMEQQDICPRCISKITSARHRRARELWDELPSFFGLPAWPELIQKFEGAFGQF